MCFVECCFDVFTDAPHVFFVNLCSHSIPIDILHVISATCLQPLFSLFSILQHLNNWNVLKLSFKRQDHSYNNNFVLSDFSWQVAILHLQNCFFLRCVPVWVSSRSVCKQLCSYVQFACVVELFKLFVILFLSISAVYEFKDTNLATSNVS